MNRVKENNYTLTPFPLDERYLQISTVETRWAPTSYKWGYNPNSLING